MSEGADQPVPGTNWEYALSAADELTLWYLSVAPSETARVREHQAPAVVLLAAAIHAAAAARELTAADVAQVRLEEVGTGLSQHAVSAVESAPASVGVGGDQRDQLLADVGSEAFATACAAAGQVLDAHLADGGGSIADRAGVMATARRARRMRALQALEDE